MRRTDARRRKRDRPDGVIQGFHVIAYKVDPRICVLARNLLSKDRCRAALADEVVPVRPEMPLVSKAKSCACRGERLARTGIFRDMNDGHYYETAPALEGIIDAFHTHALRQNRPMPLEALRVLARKLRYAMPLEMSDIKGARTAVRVLRAESMEMTLQYANDLIRTTQIRIELDEREAA